MKKEELAYIAGFTDGEGQLSITKHKPSPPSNTRFQYHTRFDIHNTKLFILKHIQQLIGGTISIKKPRKANHSTAYTLTITRQEQIINVLRMLFPFLILKKPQAKLLHKFLVLRKIKRYDGFKPEEIEIYEQIKELNKKGEKK